MPQSHKSAHRGESRDYIPYQMTGMSRMLPLRDKSKPSDRRCSEPRQTDRYSAAKYASSRPVDGESLLPPQTREKRDELPGSRGRRNTGADTAASPVQSPGITPAPSGTSDLKPSNSSTMEGGKVGPALAFVAATWLVMFLIPWTAAFLPSTWGFHSTPVPIFSLGPSLVSWSERLTDHVGLELPARHEESHTARRAFGSLERDMTRLLRDRETLTVGTWDALVALPDAIRSQNVTGTKHYLHLVHSSTRSMGEGPRRMGVQLTSTSEILSKVADTARSYKEFHREGKIAALYAKNETAFRESDDLRAEYDCIEQYTRQAFLLIREGRRLLDVEREVEDKYHIRLTGLVDETFPADGRSDLAVDWDGLGRALAEMTIQLATLKQTETPRGYQWLLEETGHSREAGKDEYAHD